jgi:hypothetical protein
MTSDQQPIPYLSFCNPPRKAKRARCYDDTQLVTPPSSTATSPTFPAVVTEQQQQQVHQLQRDISAGPDNVSNTSAPTASKKRTGRKPGSLSRAQREAQRKMNHSLIEKARRTKINDALATLSSLIPRDPASADDDDGHKPSAAGAANAEREFKLEILEKAVTYLQELTAKVREYECAAPHRGSAMAPANTGLCRNCAGSGSSSASAAALSPSSSAVTSKKRKRRGEEDYVDGDGYEADTDNNHHHHSDAGTPQLPPISSWLPLRDYPLADPSAIPLTPGESPHMRPMPAHHHHHHNNPSSSFSSALSLAHLHVSSPVSIQQQQQQQQQPLPLLTLPSPSLKPFAHAIAALRTTAASAPPAPAPAPATAPPSPEDRSAATMLLQIASSSSSPSRGGAATGAAAAEDPFVKPHTPSSILGLLREAHDEL